MEGRYSSSRVDLVEYPVIYTELQKAHILGEADNSSCFFPFSVSILCFVFSNKTGHSEYLKFSVANL